MPSKFLENTTNELISCVKEYYLLLGFIGQNFPDVLEKWKNMNAGVDEVLQQHQTQTQTFPMDNQKMTTNIESTNKHLSVFFPLCFKRDSEDGKRDWTIYSKEQFRRFWDFSPVEHRK